MKLDWNKILSPNTTPANKECVIAVESYLDRCGLAPEIHPCHFYNYYEACRSGYINPYTTCGHLPSQFKVCGHPNMFVSCKEIEDCPCTGYRSLCNSKTGLPATESEYNENIQCCINSGCKDCGVIIKAER